MARKHKNMVFKTSRQDKADMKKFAAILVSCVVGILAISVFAILSKHDFDVKSALGGDAESTTEIEETTENPVAIKADKTYLFWCADDNGKVFRFAWLVNFRLPERRVSVCALNPDDMLNVSADSQSDEKIFLSVKDVFHSHGIKEIVSLIENGYGINIDGYIGSEDESFKTMINYLGGVDITVPEQIEYKASEFAVILVKGKQNLKGDTLFKYLRYLSTLGEKGKNQLTYAMNEMLDYVFKSSNIKRGEAFFSKISNTLETDLSIVDFSTSEEGIKIFMQEGFSSKKTLDSPEEFNED